MKLQSTSKQQIQTVHQPSILEQTRQKIKQENERNIRANCLYQGALGYFRYGSKK